MSRKFTYQRIDISPHVRYYASPGVGPAATLDAEDYARAREAICAWCLDGLVCAKDDSGRRVVVLAVRGGAKPADGPFRGEPWVVGGRWDMVTPWERFVVEKARKELFGGAPVEMAVSGPIGGQLFATGWGKQTDGPFGRQGVTLQYCYRLVLKDALTALPLRPDAGHSSIRILSGADDLSELHPYIRDVIELSGWLSKG